MLNLEKFSLGVHDYIRRALFPLAGRIAALEKLAPVQGPKGDRGDAGESVRGERGEVGAVGPKGDAGKDADPLAIAKAIEEGIAKALQGAVERAITALLPDIIRRASDAPKPQDGKEGAPGRDADDAGILASLTEHMLRAVDALPKPADGRNGSDGDPGRPGVDGKDAPAVDEQAIVERVRAMIQTPKDGRDGESVDFDAVVAKAVSLISVPKDGTSGTSVTMDDVRPVMEAETSRWQLEFERRAADVLRDAIDKMPKPKDGADGRDGISLDEADVKLEGRLLTFKFRCGERIVEKSIRVDFPLHKGVYRSGASHEKDDVVTFGGSQWMARRDTKTKPPSDDWVLVVQRGRDGRDAKDAE